MPRVGFWARFGARSYAGRGAAGRLPSATQRFLTIRVLRKWVGPRSASTTSRRVVRLSDKGVGGKHVDSEPRYSYRSSHEQIGLFLTESLILAQDERWRRA